MGLRDLFGKKATKSNDIIKTTEKIVEITKDMPKSKTDAVLIHLKEHGSITSLEAFELYGATRLSAIIYELKNRHGYNITTRREKMIDRYGREVRFARYYIVA